MFSILKYCFLLYTLFLFIGYVHGDCDVTCVNKTRSEQVNLLLLTMTSPGWYIHQVTVPAPGQLLSVVEQNMLQAMQIGDQNILISRSGACINPTILSCVDVIMFYTGGELNFTAQQGWADPITNTNLDYMMNWISEGHGFVGVHPATDTFHTFRPYIDMVGGEFGGHGNIDWGLEFKVNDINSTLFPIVSHIPDIWNITDEFYGYIYQGDDLYSLIETSYYNSHLQLNYNYIQGNWSNTWVRSEGLGRVFYTGLGHTSDQWNYDTDFKRMVYKGILWAAGVNITDIQIPEPPSSHSNQAKITYSFSLAIIAYFIKLILEPLN